jgi:molybdenum cofactor biosynthesis protein B
MPQAQLLVNPPLPCLPMMAWPFVRELHLSIPRSKLYFTYHCPGPTISEWDASTGQIAVRLFKKATGHQSCRRLENFWETSMSQAVTQHHQSAPATLNLAVMTVSDTRNFETDTSGALILALANTAGHRIVERLIIPDEPGQMRPKLVELSSRADVDAILVTGGTGISPRDQTFETVCSLLSRPLPGYGELFRMLSYQQIGPACILSRAVGGLIGSVPILVMPGSRAAVELAMTRIILPELPHIVGEAKKR